MAKRQNEKIGAVLYDSPWIFERCKSKRGLMALETIHCIWQSDSDTRRYRYREDKPVDKGNSGSFQLDISADHVS